MRRRLDPRRHVAAFGFHLPGLLGAAGAGSQGQPGHGADGGQGLATKAQAHDPLQVFQVADLAGGVTGQGQGQVIRRDAAAIVTYPQQLDYVFSLNECLAEDSLSCVEDLIERADLRPDFLVTWCAKESINAGLSASGIWQPVYENEDFILWKK